MHVLAKCLSIMLNFHSLEKSIARACSEMSNLIYKYMSDTKEAKELPL